MKIFGHPWIESEAFYQIETIEAIAETASNSTLKIDHFNIEFMSYCDKNSLAYMVVVSSIKEAIFANLFHAKYMLASKQLAKELMPIAQNYLFDSLVIASIEGDEDIEEMAQFNIDGVFIT